MALDKEAANKILIGIDRNELAQLGCELTSIPSPTGKEKAIAEFILAWFATKAVRQDVEVDRPNATVASAASRAG
jgi:putative aminopeptidase FrvX